MTGFPIRRTLIVGACVSALALGGVAGTASAAGDKTLRVATPRANTVELTVTNTNVDNGYTCQVDGFGPTTFRSGLISVGPRNRKTVTVGDVPAGRYTLSWGCNSFAQEKHYVTVYGKSTLPARPHVVPNGPGAGTRGGGILDFFGSLG